MSYVQRSAPVVVRSRPPVTTLTVEDAKLALRWCHALWQEHGRADEDGALEKRLRGFVSRGD